MKAYILTRSYGYDYGFLQHEPPPPWWTAFGALTQFEHPSLIWETDGAKWQLFASAIRSSRHDCAGARIRFSLAAEGTREDAEGLIAVIAAWMRGPGLDGNPLARALDKAFTEEDCEARLAARRFGGSPNDAVELDLQERLAKVVAELPKVAKSESRSSLPRWYGEFSPRFAGDFCAHIDAVLSDGERGGAYVLTLAHPVEDAVDFERAVESQGERVAILSPLVKVSRPTPLLGVHPVNRAMHDSHPDPPPKAHARPEA